MTRSCCPHCRLRFSPETAAEPSTCPFCARPLACVAAPATLGLRLIALDRLAAAAPEVERAAAPTLADGPIESS
jgi:hypothetical protein